MRARELPLSSLAKQLSADIRAAGPIDLHLSEASGSRSRGPEKAASASIRVIWVS